MLIVVTFLVVQVANIGVLEEKFCKLFFLKFFYQRDLNRVLKTMLKTMSLTKVGVHFRLFLMNSFKQALVLFQTIAQYTSNNK